LLCDRNGGEIVAAGAPEDIVKAKRSYTGEFLKPVLARGSRRGKKGQVAAEQVLAHTFVQSNHALRQVEPIERCRSRYFLYVY
jgi:hypothetical protein